MKNNHIFLIIFLVSILPYYSATYSESPSEVAPVSISSAAERLNFVFTLWHTDTYDQDCWQTLSQRFSDLGVLCQQSEHDVSDLRWIEMLGAPFYGVATATKDKQGIHGNVSISVDSDQIKLEAVLFHEDDYDAQAWAAGMELARGFFNNDLGESKKEPAWLKELAPLFSESIALCSENDQGIHGAININVE